MITRDILCENHTQFPVFDKAEKFDDNKIVRAFLMLELIYCKMKTSTIIQALAHMHVKIHLLPLHYLVSLLV